MTGVLQGTVALVTGATGGLGRAICAAFADAGATVVATDLPTAKRDGVRHDLWVDHDVTSRADWDRVVADISKHHSRLDILVNNAGVCIIDKFEDMPFEAWRKTQSVNIDSHFIGIQAVLPLMKESGKLRAGGAAIVNVSSVAGLIGANFNAAYCASKGAVRLFTKALALEFSALGYKIRVNSVHPGGIDTNMVNSIFESYARLGVIESAEKAYELSAAEHPIGRMAQPSEIAAGIRFMCSDDASYMHGAELVLDGGYTAK